MKTVAVLLIKLYQITLSPLFRGSCRYHPSCSNYGIEALKTHGFLTGSYLTIKRILKCNPFFEGGIDNVPPRKDCSHDINRLSVKAE